MKSEIKLLLSTIDLGGRSLKRVNAHYFWKGGTPGFEYDWNVPSNWHNRNIPGWFDTVIISPEYTSNNHFPIINSFVNDIACLLIEKRARLTIANSGRLCIDGMEKIEWGLNNFGQITIWGELTIQRTQYGSIYNHGTLVNFGSIAVDFPEQGAIVQTEFSKLQNHGELVHLSI